jgi:hypothetical protein
MKRIWILVMVKRGFIEEPEIFLDKRSAQARKRELLQDFNPDYDEIDIFKKTLPLPVPPYGIADTHIRTHHINAGLADRNRLN